MLPLLATVRGVGLSLVRAPRFLPYWVGFLLYNYRAMFGELLRPAHKPISVGGNAAWLAAARIAPMVTGFLFWALAALVLPPEQIGLGSAVVAAALLTVQLGMLGVGPATLTLLPAETDGGRRLIATSLLTVATFSLLGAGLLVARHRLARHRRGRGLERPPGHGSFPGHGAASPPAPTSWTTWAWPRNAPTARWSEASRKASCSSHSWPRRSPSESVTWR